MANLLPLGIFNITIFFRKNHLFFQKETQNLNVLRNFTISFAFYGKIATSSDFEKIQNFFFEKPFYFLRKTQIWKVSRNFSISVAF